MTIFDSLQSSRMPMWMLMYMSQFIFLFMICSLCLDALIILLFLKIFKVNMMKIVALRTIIMAWILGFSSDILSLIFLQIIHKIIKGVDFYYIYSNGTSIVVHIISILMSAVLTYFMTYFLFKRVAIPRKIAFRMAIILSTLSAPWLFIVPTYTMY